MPPRIGVRGKGGTMQSQAFGRRMLLGTLCAAFVVGAAGAALAAQPVPTARGGATPSSAAAAAPSSQVPFLANWTGKGSIDQLPFGSGRTVATFRQTGTLTTLRQGLVGNALTKCVGLEDGRSNDHAYCVWIDAKGREIRVKLGGDLGGTRDTGMGYGSFVGGSGPFQHLRGSFKFEWVLLPTDTPGTFQFKTVQMSGSYRIAAK